MIVRYTTILEMLRWKKKKYVLEAKKCVMSPTTDNILWEQQARLIHLQFLNAYHCAWYRVEENKQTWCFSLIPYHFFHVTILCTKDEFDNLFFIFKQHYCHTLFRVHCEFVTKSLLQHSFY